MSTVKLWERKEAFMWWKSVLGTRHIFVFLHASRISGLFFRHFLSRHRRFASCVINFQLLKVKTCFPIRFHRAWGQTLPSPPSGHPHPSPPSGQLPPMHPGGGQTLPSPPSGHPLPLLAVVFTPSTQRPSSTPSSGQIYPSPPNGHPPPLLAVKHFLYIYI